MGFKARASTSPDSPDSYIAAQPEPQRSELRKLHALIRQVAPELEPNLDYGMLGYGRVHYRYASGREGQWFRVGVASRKHGLSLYCCGANEHGYVAEQYKERLPKANIGKGCVRFRRVEDLDEAAVRSLIRDTITAQWGV